VELAAKDARERVARTLDAADTDPRRAYYQFAMTFEEANAMSVAHGGEDLSGKAAAHAPVDREPCEDHDDSLRGCCGTRQLGPHAQDCRLSATMQAGMGDHERMYSHETEVT